jgi:poly(ADP-ribose) glycohydrolase ARH3
MGRGEGQGGGFPGAPDPLGSPVPITPRSRARGAFLGTFLGDAAGLPFEGARPGPVHDRAVAARLSAPSRWGYSDDTEMAISLAESVVERGGFDFAHAARTMAERHQGARGYAKGTLVALEEIARGIPPEEAARSFRREGSRGNGAAVRVAPLALRYAPDPQAFFRAAAESARITHVHEEGIAGAVVMARALAFAMVQEPGRPVERERLLAAFPREGAFRVPLATLAVLLQDGAGIEEAAGALHHGPLAIDSVPLAIFCFARFHPDSRTAIQAALSAGGDTDTIAAMAGALAGAGSGVESFPTAWLDALEDGPRGRRHVEDLADQLIGLS